MPKKAKARKRYETPCEPGQVAKEGEHTLRTVNVGSVPIINHILTRMRLGDTLRQHLRPDRPRTRLPTVTGLLVLLRNLLISREPIYGVGEWAARYAPELLGLTTAQLECFNDDRIGRCLDRLFETSQQEMVMDVVRHVVKEFGLGLEELHNDSTTVSFYGSYDAAAEEAVQRGRKTPAITYGHSKAHRPDLKQLLYVLTVTDDGGVPVYFSTKSGNTVDDQTHRETWDILRALIGSASFLYVADCKLATTDNMKYIDRQGGQFVTVLPANRKEDRQFRDRLLSDPNAIQWDLVYHVHKDDGEIVDRLAVCPEETLSKEKYRLWWFHSTRKARLDATTRLRRIERATAKLRTLRDRLLGLRPRMRSKEQVEPAVAEILTETGASGLLRVDVRQHQTEMFRQTTPGRPGKNTKYAKELTLHCDLAWEIDTKAIAELEKTDGVFPLITNSRGMTAEEVLRAYKRQPIIEKRFSQLKTDFDVAPVYLQNVSRIQALLCLYFFTLMVQTLLERELRQAMQAAELEDLPLYPEGRSCKNPTTRRVIDIFESVQRHTLQSHSASQTLDTELSPLQKTILKLLSVSRNDYAS